MPTVSLRPARPADAGAIGEIWAAGWRDGHLGNVPQALVDVRTPESFGSRAAQRVGDAVVAVVDGDVVGFVAVLGDEVDQVFVSAGHRGTGVAAALLAEAERVVAAAGHRVAWLAVVAGNARARRFYARQGWVDDGAFDYAAATPDGPIAVPCHRYVKSVGPAVATPTFCVVGAGAIGGLIGARLAAAGYPTAALARGETLDALRAHGWRLRTGAGPTTGPAVAEGDPAALGAQDVVVLATKAHALPRLAPTLAPLFGPRTVVVPAINGVPWWFFDGIGGPFDGLRLRAVDPDGALAAAIPASRVLGCVVHVSASVVAPGHAVLHAGNGLILGEPAGGSSARLARITGALRRAGFDVTEAPRIQRDIWYKLWGNMTVNPISALTGAAADRILDDDLVVALIHAVMREAAAIGDSIGCPIAESPADRTAVTRRLGSFKTSMLQDAEAGRPLELDALLTVVREIGAAVRVPTPHLDGLLGLARLAARGRGLYPPDQAG